MRYINKSFVPIAQEVPKEPKQSYNKVPIMFIYALDLYLSILIHNNL